MAIPENVRLSVRSAPAARADHVIEVMYEEQ
jgi:hypothetical protein